MILEFILIFAVSTKSSVDFIKILVRFAQEEATKATLRTGTGMDAGCIVLKYHGGLDDSVSVPLK